LVVSISMREFNWNQDLRFRYRAFGKRGGECRLE
jgi:hypothetical protein